MATYDEIFLLGNDHVMKNKVSVAAVVKADAISSLATPTQLQLDWAIEAYRNPIGIATTLWYAMLGANNALSVAQITSATDSAIQSAVDDVVDNVFTKAGV